MTPTRQQIVRLLWREPGLSTRGIARAVDLDESTAGYHLHRLAKEGEIVVERVGRIAAHYPNGWGDEKARRYAALSADARVALAVLKESPGPHRAVDVERRTGLTRLRARAALELAARLGLARRVGLGKFEEAT